MAKPDLRHAPAPRALLRMIDDLTEVSAFSDTTSEVIEVTAEAARQALDAASLSVGRALHKSGTLRMLVNVGRLGPGEVRWPQNDTYAMSEYPHGDSLFSGEDVGFVTNAHRTDADPIEAALLRALGKSSSLEVPIIVDDQSWGILWASRDDSQRPFDDDDLNLASAISRRLGASFAQAEYLAKVARLAYEDSLTGLANRRAADERLDRALHRHRSEGLPVSLVVCDVNGLKRVNDEMGHDAGDVLLMDIAEALRLASTLIDGGLAARLGGDEFCIVLEGHGLDAALEVGRRICELTARLSGEAQVSCGVAGTDGELPVESSSTLLRLADAAQYHAKRSHATQPVVAGRDALPAHLSPLRDPGERRGLRARRVEPGRMLDMVLRALDEVRGAPTLARLEMAAERSAALLDAAGWCVSLAAPGSSTLTTCSASAFRGSWERPGDWRGTVGAQVSLDDHPDSAAAITGGSFLDVRDGSGVLPAPGTLLANSQYNSLLAGGTNAEGGWLVQIYTDELGAPVDGLATTLRALVAVAITG